MLRSDLILGPLSSYSTAVLQVQKRTFIPENGVFVYRAPTSGVDRPTSPLISVPVNNTAAATAESLLTRMNK